VSRARFSARATFPEGEGAVAHAHAVARARGRAPFDLTASNPTRVGLAGLAALPAELARPGAHEYDPSPLGPQRAREAVAAYYAAHGVLVEPDRVVLAASTSELYGWLFKLLCDPGDAVLVPSPSYPLFDVLAALEGVRLARYPLLRDEAFRVDTEAALRALSHDDARALLLVHPNNPTGSLVRADDASELLSKLDARGVPLVSDEVFLDYPLERSPGAAPTFATAPREGPLRFVLSGLSKVLCAPGLKLSWCVLAGREAEVAAARARLEHVADAYLSVGTPPALALGRLLDRRFEVQRALSARLRENLAALDDALASGASVGLRRARVEAGWYALVEVPRTQTDEAWALSLTELGVLVHPGFFFELDEGMLVVSLLVEPPTFRQGIERLVRFVVSEAS
jgi:alanine-synthesizing transaminase